MITSTHFCVSYTAGHRIGEQKGSMQEWQKRKSIKKEAGFLHLQGTPKVRPIDQLQCIFLILFYFFRENVIAHLFDVPVQVSYKEEVFKRNINQFEMLT